MRPEQDGPPGTRCFLAVTPPRQLVEAAERISQELAEKADGVRWVPPDQMHITLRFFPSANDALVENIKAAAAECAATKKPFTAALVGVDGFPNLRMPQALFIPIVELHPRMKEFHRHLEIALFDRDIRQDSRPFSPHLTIGRVKRQMKGAKLDKLVKPYKETNWGAWTVNRLDLYRSRLGPEGAQYDLLGDWPLGSGG